MGAAKVIQVIETTLTRKGNGKDDPIRIVTEYWSTEGKKLAEVDPCYSNNELNTPFNKIELWALEYALKGLDLEKFSCTLGEVDINILLTKIKMLKALNK